jgi:hypothetical protein
MLTSYMVKCNHSGCGWFGSLLPTGPVKMQGSPPVRVVEFRCPKCARNLRGRVRNDDVIMLPHEEPAVATV